MQEVSLQDYPGKISTIVWVNKCNKRCWWCSNPEFVNGKIKAKINENDVISKIIEKNKTGKWIEAIVICGGEPTIFKGLSKFLYNIRDKIPYLKIKLDTNGIKLNVLKKIIKNDLVDYIAMDIKPSEFDNKDYLKSVEIVKNFILKKDGEFRWTLYPGSLDSKDRFLEIFKDANKIYFQRFSRKMKLLKDNNKKEYSFKELNNFYEEIKNKLKKVDKRW